MQRCPHEAACPPCVSLTSDTVSEMPSATTSCLVAVEEEARVAISRKRDASRLSWSSSVGLPCSWLDSWVGWGSASGASEPDDLVLMWSGTACLVLADLVRVTVKTSSSTNALTSSTLAVIGIGISVSTDERHSHPSIFLFPETSRVRPSSLMANESASRCAVDKDVDMVGPSESHLGVGEERIDLVHE